MRIVPAKSPAYLVASLNNGAIHIDGETSKIQSFDLLISDVMMPGMNGYELYESLAEKHPHLKAIFISGYTEVGYPPNFERSTEVAFLSKPFTWQQLLEVVQNTL